MPLIFYAIWEFLVALAPLLEAFGSFLVGLLGALYEIAKMTAVVTAFLAVLDLLFDPRGKQRVGQLIANVVGGGLSFVKPLATELAPTLNVIVQDLINVWNETGPGLSATFGEQFQTLATAALLAQREALPAGETSTPDNAIDNAALFFKVAFGFGLSSAAVTAAFEALTPEKLNTLNGAGPMLANLAGFGEVAEQVLGPLYKYGFGRSLEYKYASQFRPELPDRDQAESLFARGIITAAQRDSLVGYSGLSDEYAPFTQAGAYRPLSPRILARAMDFGTIQPADLTNVLTFGGIRASDQVLLQDVFAAAAIEPYQKMALSSLILAAERGNIPDNEIVGDLQQLNVPDAGINFVLLAIAYRREEQLAELLRKSVSEGYKYGTVLDQDYVTNLEAIGINAADAEAHYAVDSIAKQGRALALAERQALALSNKQTSAAMRAAIAEYRAGELDAGELLGVMVAAGVNPVIAGYAVTLQTAKTTGALTYVYGQLLPRAEATLVREEVQALAVQVRAGLVTPAAALGALADLKVPAANAAALVAEWAATKTPAADVGVLEPR